MIGKAGAIELFTAAAAIAVMASAALLVAGAAGMSLDGPSSRDARTLAPVRSAAAGGSTTSAAGSADAAVVPNASLTTSARGPAIPTGASTATAGARTPASTAQLAAAATTGPGAAPGAPGPTSAPVPPSTSAPTSTGPASAAPTSAAPIATPTPAPTTASPTPALTPTPVPSTPRPTNSPAPTTPAPTPTAAPTTPAPTPTAAPTTPAPTATPVPTAQPSGFGCTLFIGYSQTNNWWWFGGFESVTDNDRYELLFNFGGAIRYWADPSYSGWASGITSRCQPGSAPDRIVLDVTEDFFISTTDPAQNVAKVANDIRAAIATARSKYPTAQQVWLQPVVGGPGGAVCSFGGSPSNPVRASWNHPFIDQAISQVVGGTVVRGPSPEVRTCADYEDNIGHLTDSKGPIGQTIGNWYNAR